MDILIAFVEGGDPAHGVVGPLVVPFPGRRWAWVALSPGGGGPKGFKGGGPKRAPRHAFPRGLLNHIMAKKQISFPSKILYIG